MAGTDSILNKPKPVVSLDQSLLDGVVAATTPYPIPQGRKYEYGTAGVSKSRDIFSNKDADNVIVPYESVCEPTISSQRILLRVGHTGMQVLTMSSTPSG